MKYTATATLTHKEAMHALRYYYDIPDGAEIIIEDPIVPVTTSDGWISNVGRYEAMHPPQLNDDTMVEVKWRNGELKQMRADATYIGWRETDGTQYDIIAYRIVK